MNKPVHLAEKQLFFLQVKKYKILMYTDRKQLIRL